MNEALEKVDLELKGSPAAKLEVLVQSQLEHALDGEKRGLKVYESLRNLNEVIGTQYGDRVLYELIQNAHDAHPAGDQGKIAIRLVVDSSEKGTLYVANGGVGFRAEDVEAIRNIGTSAKEVGEGIGTKGLGFRSIEALTDDPRIYSQPTARKSERFDGYRFKFGDVAEIEALLVSFGGEAAIRHKVANTIPRYLVTLPLDDQPSDVVAYAQRGYATVVVVPLHTPEAVRLATEQTRALADLDVPLLLFLDRIGQVRIDVDVPDEKPFRRVLRRRQERLGQVTGLAGCELYQVDVSDRHRFLVVRLEVEKARVLDAVRRSLSRAPQLNRWLDWKGEPVVSIAVSLNKDGITAGRLYNFLPMGERATAPLMGYLDAPFFADIDRRIANLDLPLNETLMEAAAEACAAGAISIVEQGLPVPPHAVFDLIAWMGDHASKLDDAVERMGTSLEEATVIPAIAVDGRGGWSSLSEIKLWPSGRYSVLKPRDVARRIGARLVLPDLGKQRVERLEELADKVYENLVPSAQQLSQWAEQFAATLIERKASPRIRSRYYDDIRRLFGELDDDLGALAGRRILLDRSRKLRPAGRRGYDAQSKVYIRMESSRRKRSSGGVPLPPSTLARRYRFLDERIAPAEETISAFVKASLLRIYDPVEALAGLKGALGRKANENRRREALVWAFQVWRATGPRLEGALQKADVYVPTRAGWQPAKTAAFSSSWTRLGRSLENYLVEASEISADCRHARDRLLVPYSDWPGTSQDGMRHWVRFLEAIGVVDGLRPISSRITRKGYPAYYWDYLLWRGEPSEGLDDGWCAEVRRIEFNYRYTEYEIRGAAWRLPGQIEYDEISDAAREVLSHLIFEHLKAHGNDHFHFKVGRFERTYQRDWDVRTLPTPLAVFLRSKRWIAASSRDGVVFRRPSECWAARRRGRGEGPPRFLDRLPDAVAAELAETKELADLVFSEAVGLRDWQSQATAVERLRDLASTAGDLAANERPVFRKEYQRAWSDAVATGAELAKDLSVAVTRRGQLEVLKGDPSNPPTVVVTEHSRSFEARVLSAARHALLEVGEASTEDIVTLLEASKGFVPRRLDGIGVRLLVDGKPFAPRATDPTLISLGLAWLPDVVVVVHELLAEQLERGIVQSTLGNRARAIRIRKCGEISLFVDDQVISSDNDTPFYAFEHDKLPTLILTNAVDLSWRTLGRTLSKPILRLIDSRLRSVETVLLRLAIDLESDDLDAPSEEALARALDRDVETIHEHLLALRTDMARVLHILLPVVTYYSGVEAAERLRADAERLGPNFDAKAWLTDNLGACSKSPDELIDACEQVGDRTEVRRRLDLDYKAFNQALADLGETTLSNEPELQRLYEAHLRELKTEIIDRLRRRHVEDFRQGRDLSVYLERKELKFLPFDKEWIFTRETLEPEVVKGHVSRLLQEALGDDMEIELRPLHWVVEKNRRTVQQFAAEAMPLVRVWCRKHGVAIPAPWDAEGAQAVVRLLENEGLLDFEMIEGQDIPRLCRRAGCWPDNMGEMLGREALGLEENEVREEERCREEERRRAEVERRTIKFAGTPLDTGDPSFADKLKEIADRFLSSDDAWFDRSSNRVKLATFLDVGGKSDGGGPGGTGKRRSKSDRQLTEAQRDAMGLASEWLAYQYLRRRHPGYVDEDSWVSENRQHFFGGAEGDDAAGYDFRVEAPQAEWLYEVKSSLEDSGEFELTANELRVASGASKDRSRRYRILYVPYVFSPEKWCVLELPNPMGEKTRNRFETIGRGSVRLRFERR